ncbi:zinc-binding alcohol dehydrogenase family protein [Pseudoalteromonas sp. DL-6]|uniref:zinc-binding alcohol dehydrogenase family protein n=1 Tax=Pseudoalteromonas sp. DL-6 TaxID=1390185 RepID=UPI00103EA767|nr:zinc-binding alcohol dehydrogenase family protein [Pseudoalteromonas sp. DL-6]QBJ63700.1 NADPH:quinone reductase [Pseudoalteromonas sp. DL-6]
MSIATKKMKAIGFTQSLPVSDPHSLHVFDADYPKSASNDVIVKISAVSINPADAKIRIRAAKNTTLDIPRIAGYDAVGTIVGLGDEVKNFALGDRVYYAGDVSRQGSNAEYQVVDSRIIALAPNSLTDAEAAALPLTALTGWEALFDRLHINHTTKGKSLLIIGGAGGVGSITTQIAKQLTNLTVITTASRPKTIEWSKKMGADYVANHHDLVPSVKALGFETVDYIFNTADTVGHWDAMAELIAPQGMICSIVEFDGGVDLSKLQGKSAGFVWELMFTRSLFNTPDIEKQGEILQQVANLVDAGRIRTTLNETLTGFNAETLRAAHEKIESGTAIGKTSIIF